MSMRRSGLLVRVALAVTVWSCAGCGENAMLLNPSFVNYAVGGIVPLTPGASSGFILVRVSNGTPNNIRFVVTAERKTQVIDENGLETTETSYETVRLQTYPASLANDVGILFDCPVTRVGLGENIDFPDTEAGLYIDAVPGEAEGFGVPGFVNPLSAEAGNFSCGDTIIFEARVKTGAVGSVEVTAFVLSAAERPTEVSGPDTFNNARTVIEQFLFDEE